MTPTKELFTVRPSPETLMDMLIGTLPERHCISDIPATPHHHHACRGCHITLACFESDCTKTGDTCHDCATGERPAWSASDELRRHRARQAEQSRRQLIEMLVERLEGLTHMELVRVASFINEVEGR